MSSGQSESVLGNLGPKWFFVKFDERAAHSEMTFAGAQRLIEYKTAYKTKVVEISYTRKQTKNQKLQKI